VLSLSFALQALLPATVATTFAASVVSVSLTGGTGTTTVGGTLYAKQGGALTLKVTTDTDTQCVVVTGSFAAAQHVTGTSSNWTFPFTAGSGDGSAFVTATAGSQFNANSQQCNMNRGAATAPFVLDNTGPTLTAALLPQPNTADWNKSNVSITWSATDAGSGIGTGPTPASDSQTADTTASTKTATASDRLGNIGTGAITVKLDETAPSILGTRTPAANASGWNNADVTVSFSCSDATSGIKSCTGGGTTILSTEGANQSVNAAATDNADNTASTSVSGISIDKAPPSLSGAPTTSPNTAGWYTGNVAIHWTASDALSGLVGAAPADSTISGEGSALTASASVSDKAGNTTNATSLAVKIDKTAPNTTASVPSGWSNTNVTVSL